MSNLIETVEKAERLDVKETLLKALKCYVNDFSGQTKAIAALCDFIDGKDQHD